MTLAAIDTVVALVFAIGFPLITGPIYLRRRAALQAGDSRLKRQEYLETIAWLSAMGVVSVVVWVTSGRDFALLGLGFDASWRAYLAIAVAAVVSALLALQVRTARRDPATRDAARAALQPVSEYLPRTSREAWLFRGVSLSAGLGEELFYRGFLIWYITQFASWPWAVVVSSLLFGLAHAMHGVQSTIRSTVMGFVLAGLYMFSGALWAPMLLHTAVDLTSGEMGMAAFGGPPAHGVEAERRTMGPTA